MLKYGVLLTLAASSLAVGLAQTAATVPDFSGVYYTFNPNAGRGAPPATAAAGQQKGQEKAAPARRGNILNTDGSAGRTADEPALRPEYLAKWEMMSKSRIAGSYEYDNTAKCFPPGMPWMMSMAYGMEVMQNKDKITMFSELNDALRRIYLDGRKASQKVLDDPTYAGYSTGQWEGDTLVVDTVALHPDSYIVGFTPHSDQMTVHERIHLLSPGILEDHIYVNDPKALLKPWEIVRTYRKATPGKNDELREFACPESLGAAK